MSTSDMLSKSKETGECFENPDITHQGRMLIYDPDIGFICEGSDGKMFPASSLPFYGSEGWLSNFVNMRGWVNRTTD